MIVIAAAGLSKRFKNEGYLTPKVMLDVGGKPMLRRVLDGFSDYKNSEDFVVVTNKMALSQSLSKDCLHGAGIDSFEVVSVKKPDGMIPNVAESLARVSFELDQPLTISVADIIRKNFKLPERQDRSLVIDYALKEGKNEPETFIEKVQGYYGVGCYHFSSAREFMGAYQKARSRLTQKFFGEKAMEITEAAKMLAHLKLIGYTISGRRIDRDDIVECGTPAQYKLACTHYTP